jgi:hypothetical protein
MRPTSNEHSDSVGEIALAGDLPSCSSNQVASCSILGLARRCRTLLG